MIYNYFVSENYEQLQQRHSMFLMGGMGVTSLPKRLKKFKIGDGSSLKWVKKTRKIFLSSCLWNLPTGSQDTFQWRCYLLIIVAKLSILNVLAVRWLWTYLIILSPKETNKETRNYVKTLTNTVQNHGILVYQKT